jgi:hypothetical protein
MGRKRKKQFFDREENRYGLFMNENSFNLEIMYGRNYLHNDVIHEIKIHRINVIESKSHKLYGQAKAKDKKFMPPVRVNAMITVENQEQTNYGDGQGGIARDDTGKLEFGIYLQELEEKQLEINRGDIIEYNMSGERARYYEIENAQNVNDVTSQTIAGFKPYYKLITGVPVKEDVTPYLLNDNLT